jgi:hypothetical protein
MPSVRATYPPTPRPGPPSGGLQVSIGNFALCFTRHSNCNEFKT